MVSKLNELRIPIPCAIKAHAISRDHGKRVFNHVPLPTGELDSHLIHGSPCAHPSLQPKQHLD